MVELVGLELTTKVLWNMVRVRPTTLVGHPRTTTKVLWNRGASDQPTSSDTRACAQGKVIRVANIKPE